MNMELSVLSDELIIQKYRDNSEDLLDQLIMRYQPLIRQKAISIAGKNIDIDDFVQEGLIALFKAIRGYSSDNNTSFKTYATHCITNKIISVAKTSATLKNKPMVNYLSLNQDDICFNQSIEASKKDDPQEIFIKMEDISLREKKLKSLLTVFEKEALRLYLSGHSYQEIASVLDCSFKAVDNALQRVKKKLRNN